jgi:uncharacterized membrane protein YqgA involved in biofilm formation
MLGVRNTMPFLGTIINFFGVIIAGALGALVKKGIPKRIADTVIYAVGICVVFIGIDGALEAAPIISYGSYNGLAKTLIMIISMAVGALIGELVDFDRLITKLGNSLEAKLVSNEEDRRNGNFAKGFVSCSILFCVGAMAVNGGIEDGMGNPEILIAKTVIDFISCFLMATTLGIGCAFSAGVLLVYQGAFALLGMMLSTSGIVPESTIAYMSATGSLIIILIGTNMLGITKIKTANLVPAMFLPLILAPLFRWILG